MQNRRCRNGRRVRVWRFPAIRSLLARVRIMRRSSPRKCLISGRAPAQGEGASKRIAEQAAANALLTREGVGARVGDV